MVNRLHSRIVNESPRIFSDFLKHF